MIESRNTRVQLYWNTLVRIPAQIINFVISILVARILMPRDFGIMGISMMLIGYSNLFTNFGFAEAIIQKNIHDRKILNSIFTFNLFISSLLAVGFYFAAGLIADFFKTPECMKVIRVMSLVFIISSFPVVPSSILRRDMNFKVVAVFDLIQAVLMSVITLLLAYKGFGYWALVYGQIVPLTIISLLLCVKVKFFPILYYKNNIMKEIYNFGGWNFFRVQLLFISQHVDRFIVGKWLGPVNLGFYDKAITLSATPYNALIMNINSVMFSSFSIDKENPTRLQETFQKSLALLSFINFPLYLGLIAVAPHFVHSLLGNKWVPMIIPFQIILTGFIFRSFMGIATSLNVGVGMYKNQTVRSFFSLLILTVLCILFRNQNIAVIASCFMIFCILDIMLLIGLSCRAINLRHLRILQAIFPGLMSSLFMYFITVAASHFIFQAYSIINMFFIIFVGFIAFILSITLNHSDYAREFRSNLIKDCRKILYRE